MEQKINSETKLRSCVAKDVTLGWFSSELKDLDFVHPLAPASVPRNAVIESLAEEHKLCGVRPSPGNGIYYIIQSYVGGKVRSFGSVRLDVFRACRIADMLTFRFGKYRLRFPKALTEDDYNYSSLQAESDYVNEPGLREWVDKIESYLRDHGALCSDSQPRPRPAKAPAAPSLQYEDRLQKLESIVRVLENKLLEHLNEASH